MKSGLSNKVVRSSSHVKEDLSKREFEKLIHPWINLGWVSRDYGIDATIELFSGIQGTEDFKSDSKYFMIQLKSTSKVFSNDLISIRVPIKKIIHWYRANIPVLFVVFHIPSERFYKVWIDEILLAKLAIKDKQWGSKETVSIKFSPNSIFDASSKESIRDYILVERKIEKEYILDPGRFFELKEILLRIIADCRCIKASDQFKSIKSRLKELDELVSNSFYKISVTGLSRVGKSTLINNLLRSRKDEITPTGFFQTTGVPIQILPGNSGQVTVEFKNGQKQIQPLSSDLIKKYGSQDHNPENRMGVRQIYVEVKNVELEKGVTIFDIPGLDDPSDELTDITWRIVNQSNAIIYVMDISSAEYGGFIFKKDYKKHITDLGQSLDKIFLVFNKADVLSLENLQRVKLRIEGDLKNLGLSELVHQKTYFLGSNKTTNGLDSVDKLRNDIWSYLLNENKFGLFNLVSILKEIDSSIQNLRAILNTRLIDNQKLTSLQNAFRKIEEKLPNQAQKFKNEKLRIRDQILVNLDLRKGEIINQLQDKLTRIPSNQPLPSSSQIRNYLKDGVNKILIGTYSEWCLLLNSLKISIDEWMQENFKEVREIVQLNQTGRNLNLEEIEGFERPEIDLSTSFGMGALGVLFGLTISFPVSFFAGIIAFFGNLIISADDLRSKQITKILREATDRYDQTFDKIKGQYSEYMHEQFVALENYIYTNQDRFIEDLKSQMDMIGTPLSKEEELTYEGAFSQLDEMEIRLNNFSKELDETIRNL